MTFSFVSKGRGKMKTALIIMAAGLGSRFKEGIKQLSSVGMNGEIIMDYSIHDAIVSGFNKIIIVIRKDIESDFREAIGNRIEKVCADNKVELKYVFQSLENIPSVLPENRVKPWGTGQAVLSAQNDIDCPFAVINADDYYGKTSFEKIHNYLCTAVKADEYCMAGFVLGNTLSENGAVTRGVCCVDENNNLIQLAETRNIIMCGNTASADGVELDMNSSVSMNMWGFAPEFIDLLEKGFCDFFEQAVPENPLNSEFLIPVFIESLLREKKINVKVIPTNEKWFGATYKEDIPYIRKNFCKLVEKGIYNADLYSDMV